MCCDPSRTWYGLLLGAAFLLESSSAFAEPPKANPIASEWQKGNRLAPARSETHRLAAGTTVRLGANTVLEVQTKVPLPTGAEGLTPYAFAAQLTQGRVDITVDPKQRPASGVIVYGPRRTSVVARDGRLAIIADPAGIAVGVYDGKEAGVSIGSTWKQIPAGNMIVVSSKAPQGIESKLLPPPAHVVVSRPVIAIEGATEPTRATWDAVPGAQRYFLHLVNTNTNALQVLESSKPAAMLTGLNPGKYTVRVSCAEAFGIDGMASEPASVNVVGLDLPPGAFVAQQRLYLEPLQQVTLSNIDGLEASYDSAPVYFKAPSHVGLRGTQATTLHLRVPGSKERASIDLVPRALHTSIEILPAAARWPRDKILVRIELPNASVDTPQVDVIPTVTVNNQPVKLGWVRTTKRLEAVIPAPPAYPGPWVLRAVVADQHGIVLGRNFLEIASMAGVDETDAPREIHRGGH